MSSYKVNRNQVQLILEVDDLTLDVDSVIPIGLIVNELVSNTFKHAFPDGRAGEINIKLHQTEGKMLKLEVVDDGVGYEDKKVDAQSFGHRLIKALSERLKADYHISGDEGTRAVFLIKNYQIAA
jgi:two-component sensor histidine kinase